MDRISLSGFKSLIFSNILVITLFFILNSFSSAENNISFNNLQLLPGNMISVDVNLANSDSIEGMQLPFSLEMVNAEISCDTVIFEGGRCNSFGVKHFEWFSEKSELYILLINNGSIESNNDPLLPGSGKIFSIKFSYPDSLDFSKFKISKGRLKHGIRDFSFLIWTIDGREIPGSIVWNRQ